MAILLLDNYDSFTYNLVHYIERNGTECIVVRNDISLGKIKSLDFSGIMISPGPEIPRKAGCLIEVIDYYHDKKPILGVCLGHQAIGEYFGMELIKAPKPRHGKVTQILTKPSPIFTNIPSKLEVVQYNSLVLTNTKDCSLTIIAESYDHQVMAISHKTLPVFGVQFHPEAALTEHGLTLIKNWLDCCNINS